ncbi:hypothetical protein L249_7276 [Ophiocordyceps polyrhachis-furcata BCC 54312]|uniref:Uncharacterized protein n=1 Tax=Ophiocordyceps polyrhachis-furcata BCC 54312 TaxID=1330021 RepID=A0A367LBA0_9HYPO|nr:hypothetical protein L249_7276 [Ophiocordyceps polyrhachis-furcata BCC 54312]
MHERRRRADGQMQSSGSGWDAVQFCTPRGCQLNKCPLFVHWRGAAKTADYGSTLPTLPINPGQWEVSQVPLGQLARNAPVNAVSCLQRFPTALFSLSIVHCTGTRPNAHKQVWHSKVDAPPERCSDNRIGPGPIRAAAVHNMQKTPFPLRVNYITYLGTRLTRRYHLKNLCQQAY